MTLASHPFSKRELLTFAYKHQRNLVRAFVIPFVLFVLLSFVPTPRYKAESVLIVRLGSEYVYQPEGGSPTNGPTPAIPFAQEQMFTSEVAMLESDELHGQVIQAIGIDTLFPVKGLAIITSAIHGGFNSIIKAIGLEDKDAEQERERVRLAQAVLLFDKYFDILLEKDSAVIDLSFEHADHSLAVKTLDELLRLYFEKRKQVYLEPRFKLMEAEAKEKQERALAAEKALEDYKRTHNLYSLDDQRSALLEQRDTLTQRAATISSAGLNHKIADVNHQLDQLDVAERESSALQREALITSDAYSFYSHKRDEAKAFEDLERERVDSVRVIQAPIVPADPRKLQWIILLIGFFVSVLSVVCTAAYIEFSHQGFDSAQQLQKSLGLPVLAVFPFKKQGE